MNKYLKFEGNEVREMTMEELEAIVKSVLLNAKKEWTAQVFSDIIAHYKNQKMSWIEPPKTEVTGPQCKNCDGLFYPNKTFTTMGG